MSALLTLYQNEYFPLNIHFANAQFCVFVQIVSITTAFSSDVGIQFKASDRISMHKHYLLYQILQLE